MAKDSTSGIINIFAPHKQSIDSQNQSENE